MGSNEIAEAVGKSAPAVRQVVHRAREHVTAVERFQAALTTGDIQSLLDVLAPDVVLVADGGGVVPAAIRPVSVRKRWRGCCLASPVSRRAHVSGRG